MKENFEKALAFTFAHEGIKSNDKCDSGGCTKFGISLKYHPELKATWATFTKDQAAEVYRKEYWNFSNCDNLDYPMDIAVFDCNVNPGTGACHTMLSQTQDFKAFMQLRKDYYINDVKKIPKNKKYLDGWLNRCKDLINKFGN